MIDRIRWGIAKSCMAVSAGFMLLGVKAMPNETPAIVEQAFKSIATSGSLDPEEMMDEVMDEEQVQEMKEMAEARDRERIKRFLSEDENKKTVAGVGECPECGHTQETEVVDSVGMGLENCDECGHEFVVERKE